MVTIVAGIFVEVGLVTCVEAAEARRCTRRTLSAWHQLPGMERLTLELCVLSVCASQVRCSADSRRTLYGCSRLLPSSERHGTLQIVFAGGCKALRR